MIQSISILKDKEYLQKDTQGTNLGQSLWHYYIWIRWDM
jgi:hypothetical protein